MSTACTSLAKMHTDLIGIKYSLSLVMMQHQDGVDPDQLCGSVKQSTGAAEETTRTSEHGCGRGCVDLLVGQGENLREGWQNGHFEIYFLCI